MKTVSIITICNLIFILTAGGQVVTTKHVDFDMYQSGSNNDLVNNFSNGAGLFQIQTNGITGGCLDTPDSINWGNDNAIYCNRYHPFLGDTVRASISFKYDSSTINASSFQRAVSVWLNPNADFNHYIVGSINYNRRVEIYTYSWTNSPGPVLNLQNNNWYRYVLSAVFTGGMNNQIKIISTIYNLGLSGTSAPLVINNINQIISDSIFLSDTSIQASFSGTASGGARYLDDFEFHGRQGISNCTSTVVIQETEMNDDLAIYPLPAVDKLNIVIKPGLENIFSKAVILDATGAIVLNIEMDQLKSSIDISRLQPGFYFFVLSGKNKTVSKKLVILDNKS